MNSGTILHVCISGKKGTVKQPVPHATLRADYGLEADAHAGPWHRQVSLLARADIETIRASGLELAPGAFGENLVVAGLNLSALGVGTRLRIGQAELEITQIGKVCHNRCAIYYRTGDCIMPRTGLFARVVSGGPVSPGSRINVIHEIPRRVIQAAVLTVSDRCSVGLAEDTAGPAVASALKRDLQAHVSWAGLVADELDAISTTLRQIADRNLDLLVTVGGTGCGPRDVTPEATQAVITRQVPGLAEAMRSASSRTTPHALLQRGVSGIRGSTLILNLPGSQKAALENLSAILPALPHAVQLLRADAAHSTSPGHAPPR